VKVLLCHTYYQQRGGEDESFEAEARTLADHGHEVLRYTRHNDDLRGMGRLEATRRTVWNPDTYAGLRQLLRRERPAVMHCTNTFPLLSPAAYYAARAEGVPVVQSLRNYRLLCPGALFLRDGRVCEDCLGKAVPWPAVRHGCYRGSRAASLAVVALTTGHRAAGTWRRAVDLYFTLTEFARRKFVEGGLSADRLAVKPNCVHPDPGPGTGQGGYAVFAGRLSPEKGIDTLLAAWPHLTRPLRLKIVGDGPLSGCVQDAARANPDIEYLGRRPLPELLDLIGGAACLVMPSVWYETFGRTIIEAYAKGTPVVASRLGAMSELVDEGRTGELFTPGDSADLARVLGGLLGDAGRLARMRVAARQEFEARYTAESNYRQLLALYFRAREEAARRRRIPEPMLPGASP
jgi:glycosyltransferase involved in cell wall biosynthesis